MSQYGDTASNTPPPVTDKTVELTAEVERLRQVAKFWQIRWDAAEARLALTETLCEAIDAVDSAGWGDGAPWAALMFALELYRNEPPVGS